MRIICDAHDYYDSAQAFGQDFDLIYVRKELEMDSQWKRKTDKWPSVVFPYYNGIGSGVRGERNLFQDLEISFHIIGFCGKIYGALEVTQHQGKYNVKNPMVFCYNTARVDKFIEDHFKKKQIKAYYAPLSAANKHRNKNWAKPPRNKVVEFFAECEKNREKYHELFTEYYCPVFVYSHRWGRTVFTVNDILKRVEFFRVFDPVTAFQEVSMFWGSMAHPLKPIPEIPDKIMVEAKGFDKWSFRKESSKK